MDPIDLLRDLSETPGASGCEGRIADLLEAAWAPLCDAFTRDRVGNAYALLRADAAEGQAPVLAFVAHADEVGLMVTHVDERGFVQVAPLGGIDRRQLLGKEVVLHGRADVPGVVGTLPPHLTPPGERRKYPQLHAYWVDVGLTQAEARSLLRPGDPVTLRRAFTPLTGGMYSGKALDDRTGLAALHAALVLLGERRRRADVVFAASVQEEVGLRGATVFGHAVFPTAAIAVDTGFGRQPGVGEGEGYELGKGPVVARGPNVHPRVRDLLLSAARAEGVAVQEEVVAGNSGTDAWAIQTARSGVPTGVLSLPLRYMHSPVEVVHGDDVRAAGRLLAAAAARVDAAFAEGLGSVLKRLPPAP